MPQTHLDFDQLEGVFPALRRCCVASSGRKAERHLAPLRKLAVRLQAKETAIDNMVYAAQGYDDLAVILLEPCDREDTHSHQAIISDQNYPSTIRHLDQSLQLAFHGKRNVRNTVVLDARPLRSAEIKSKETALERQFNDEIAYSALEQSLTVLCPRVIVVCHCDKTVVEGGLPAYLCSSPSSAGCAEVQRLCNNHQFIKVSSVHPMYFERTTPGIRRVMREYLFDLALIVAANVLVGRTVTGFGVTNIKESALHRDLLWVTENDVASDDLIATLEALGLGNDIVGRACPPPPSLSLTPGLRPPRVPNMRSY